MDGLESTEINLSDLERTGRIDAEFYKRSNLIAERVLTTKECIPISEAFAVSDGNHMSISDEFCEDGIPYYRGQDIYHPFIEEADPVNITKKAYDRPLMRRSYLQKGDVLMSIVGAIIGNASLVTTDNDATCSCKLSIMRAKGEIITPETL